MAPSPDRWSVTIKVVEYSIGYSESSKAVQGASVQLGGAVHVTDSVGEAFFGENSDVGNGDFPNGDYPCEITKDGFTDFYCRLEVHSDRCDITGISILGGAIKRLEWRPNTPTSKHHRATFLVGLAKKVVITIPPSPVVMPTVTPTSTTQPTIPTTSPTEPSLYNLRFSVWKLPNFDQANAEATIEGTIAPACASALQPLGYSYAGVSYNWSQNYFDVQFQKTGSPIAPLVAAIAILALIVGALFAVALVFNGLAWLQQGQVVEQQTKTVADLLREGLITSDQYTEIMKGLGTTKQPTTDWASQIGQLLSQASPIILLVIVGLFLWKVVPERKVVEEKPAPVAHPEWGVALS